MISISRPSSGWKRKQEAEKGEDLEEEEENPEEEEEEDVQGEEELAIEVVKERVGGENGKNIEEKGGKDENEDRDEEEVISESGISLRLVSCLLAWKATSFGDVTSEPFCDNHLSSSCRLRLAAGDNSTSDFSS
jgi:hypothetical protein